MVCCLYPTFLPSFFTMLAEASFCDSVPGHHHDSSCPKGPRHPPPCHWEPSAGYHSITALPGLVSRDKFFGLNVVVQWLWKELLFPQITSFPSQYIFIRTIRLKMLLKCWHCQILKKSLPRAGSLTFLWARLQSTPVEGFQFLSCYKQLTGSWVIRPLGLAGFR